MMAEGDKIAAGLIRLYFDVLITNKGQLNFNDVSNKVDDYAYKTLLLKFKLQSCRRWKVKAQQKYNYFSLHLEIFAMFQSKF